MKNHRKAFSLLLTVVLVLSLLAGCKKEAAAPVVEGPAINNIKLSEYAIVYSDADTDYAKRAAEYLQSQIEERTGVQLPIQEDSSVTAAYELVVGNTEREVSAKLNADTSRDQFAFMASGNQIALEGDYFLIAAAAYYFVQTYVTSAEFKADIPAEPLICTPITQPAKNYIVMIGDGMGPNHTKLYETPPFKLNSTTDFSDGENIFYGYLLPNQGFSRTNSLTGVTDSAAGGTALSTGYKTTNYYVGQDSNHNPIKSLTELANEKGLATAVMSTEVRTGATPASFSAHANDRTEKEAILESQKAVEAAGTIIRCDFDVYDLQVEELVEGAVQETLTQLAQDPDGFFMMYEEAHIDKHSHNNELNFTFMALARFNQVIGIVMEYAFYHPDTFVLITADHETGKLLPGANGSMAFNSDNHTSTDVPVFVFGQGGEVFDNIAVENIQIPKTIAKKWGVTDFGDPFGLPAL